MANTSQRIDLGEGQNTIDVAVRNGSEQKTYSIALYIKASNSDSNDRFGRSSAALSNSTLVFAAPFENSNATGVNGDSSNNTVPDSGAVYVFE